MSSTFVRRIILILLASSWILVPPTPLRAASAYGRVELVRDRWGVPHVFADTDAGAMYGLGYAAAEERAFQMYYGLRMIQGRLAEVLGEKPSAARPRENAVDHDRKMRTFRFYRAARVVADNLDADTRGLLDAYSRGVNDYVAAHRDRLHPLFAELGLEPEPWTAADCIASWWHLGQFFAGDGTRELLQWHNRTQPRPNDGRPVPPAPTAKGVEADAAVVTRADVGEEWLGRVDAFLRDKGLGSPAQEPTDARPPAPKFSHAWVVGGSKTTTGSAVLVSDPQTPVRYPSLWHEFHVRGKTFDARGIGVPGCPGLLIGWNRDVAWGATALGADQADLFRLKTDADHPDQYFFDGQWRDMGIVNETIRVKGGADVALKVRLTHFGPVITPFAFAQAGDPEVALKRVPVCQADRETIQAMFAMMRSRDVNEFGRAVGAWQFPSIHLIAGDRKGDVGYWLAAAVPVRSPGDKEAGNAALDGTRGEADWRGFVPPDLLPHVINPRRGWVASANHRAIGTFYPAQLGLSTGSAGHTLRSWRLYERLAGRERFTPADVLAIQADDVNPARRDIVAAAIHLRDALKRDLSPDAARALGVLAEWHRRGAHSDLSDPGAALAAEINTFFRFVATPLAGVYGGGETGLTRFLQDVDRRVARDPKAPLDEREQAYIDRALAGAWQSAAQKYGDDPAQWPRRARERARAARLGAFETLDGFGPLDPGHDVGVPDLACVDGGTIKSQAAQSYTHYVPLDDVDAAMSLLPPGHSERPDDPLRTSTLGLWGSGRLHPAPLSRAAVDRIAAGSVVLSK
jgi:penicillin amidase